MKTTSNLKLEESDDFNEDFTPIIHAQNNINKNQKHEEIKNIARQFFLQLHETYIITYPDEFFEKKYNRKTMLTVAWNSAEEFYNFAKQKEEELSDDATR